MKRKKDNRFVLDSFAVLTYLKEENGWQKVKELFLKAEAKIILLYMNYINLGEVYYIAYRENGASVADRIFSLIKRWPIQFVGVAENIAIIAGRIKAENKLSYADAYVVATALHKRAKIVTGDPEFKSVEAIVGIDWLPKNH